MIIKKWGKSAAIRIPAAVLKAAHLRLEQAVEVRADKGRIVIEPVGTKTYDIDDLLKRVTPENRHELIDWGPPVGKEVW